MAKSPTQEKLEAQRHQDIQEIVIDVLSKYRGRKNQMMLVAVDLAVTDATVYRSCEELRININEYRTPGRKGVNDHASTTSH